MSCRDSAGRARRRCAEWRTVNLLRCRQWRSEQRQRCDRWETEWTQRCDRWRVESERRCDRWEEERRRECDSWIVVFRWLCTAWRWITTAVCRAWSWVTTQVCEAWAWISTRVCRLWVAVTTLVCVVWVTIGSLVCRAWVIVLDVSCAILCWLRRLRAPVEFSESRSECVFGWTSAYRAELDERGCALQVTLRIRLVPLADVTAEQLAACMARWEPAIEAAWSDQFPIDLADGACRCRRVRVALDVRWVDDAGDAHHTVTVHPGRGRADMGNWYVESTGGTAAHEAGHMLGNVDEYAEPDRCPSRVVTSDGSIMQTSQTGRVKARHYDGFQRWVTNRTCCTYRTREEAPIDP